MSRSAERRDRGPREWSPPSACSTADARGAVLLVVVMAVVAGLLAMHALSSAQLGGSRSPHADGHVHTGDHHDREDAEALAPRVAPQVLPAPAAHRAAAGRQALAPFQVADLPPGPTRLDVTAAISGWAMPFATAGSRPADTVVVATLAPQAVRSQESGPGHGLCPGATPGHCPHLHALMSWCQAVLSGAGIALLLLLLLLLALAVQRTAWTIRLALRSLSRTPHGEWRTWRYHLRVGVPSLHELCICRT
jgi:hypothetical protein